jgi:hypothetical protein
MTTLIEADSDRLPAGVVRAGDMIGTTQVPA